VRAWYEVFESLDFTQAPEQVRAPGHSEVCGLGGPGLIVESLDQAWEFWVERRPAYEQDLEYRRSCGEDVPEEPRPFLGVGGWASNCEREGFHLPDLSADGVFFDDGAGDMYFVPQVRRFFDIPVFPNLWYYGRGGRTRPMEARPDVDKLIPILKEGLLPL
jgi:hypothetical protein